MSDILRIRKAAVLGAGVMGAQIAAHLTNAGIETILFDLAAKDGPKNGIAVKAIQHLGKLSPAPLAAKELAAAITPADYDENLASLKDCDFVIEAIAERSTPSSNADRSSRRYQTVMSFAAPCWMDTIM